jgi:hypothetical protein
VASAKSDEPKYGVRVYKLSEDTLLIKQTVKSGSRTNDAYVIDEQKELHVSIEDDAAIANAVRDGVAGRLKAGERYGHIGDDRK